MNNTDNKMLSKIKIYTDCIHNYTEKYGGTHASNVLPKDDDKEQKTSIAWSWHGVVVKLCLIGMSSYPGQDQVVKWKTKSDQE